MSFFAFAEVVVIAFCNTDDDDYYYYDLYIISVCGAVCNVVR